ncbi:unnamed protein product [Rotaria sp. Silwood1]|nr:unnamed protein product [Rotaria sp. Silwood1]
MEQVPIPVIIHDLRGKEKIVDLDTNGLEVLQYGITLQEEFQDDSEEQRAYYEEVSNFLKKHLNASRVIVYHHVFRVRGPPRTADQCDQTHRNPAFDPHVDSDSSGIRKKVKEILGEEEADNVMQNRYQAINVWRPFGPNAIIDKPLAICDYRSIDVEKDVHLIELRGSINTSTAYTITRSTQDTHVWYYLSQMRSNEMFIFKIFDSKSDVAQFAFHTAFINENVLPSNVEQKSIELRCFVFYDQ